MNRNKKMVKAGALGLAAITAVGLGAGGYAGSRADAVEPAAAVIRELSPETEGESEAAAIQREGEPFKEEAVYVNADASGRTRNTTVSDWLKNAGSSRSLKDCSELTGILNVKGDETFIKESGNALTWQTAGADIYYQGKTSKEPPVSVNISYELDGKELTPEEMAGKSGSMVMHISYTNQSGRMVKVDGRNEKIYTPFTMITGVMLPVEHFTNVTVENGTLLSDGSRDIVMGISFPGLSESLKLEEEGLSELTLPEDVTIRADVTDFEMENTITVASADLLGKAGLSDIKGLDDLKDSMNRLEDASRELLDGAGTLADGAGELKEKAGGFSDGIQTLKDGVTALSEGAGTLENGIRDYTTGAGTLAGGVKSYVGGADTLLKSIPSYTAGVGQLAEGIDTLAGAAGELPEKLGELGSGLSELEKGLDALAGAEGLDALEDGALALAQGVGGLHTGLEQAQGGVASVYENLSNLEASYANNEKILSGLKAVEASAGDPRTKAALEQLALSLEQTTAAQKKGIGALKEATAPDGTLGAGIGALADSTKEGGALQTGALSLRAGIEQLVSGGAKLKEALPTLKAGSTQIASAAGELPGALKQLKEGAGRLTANSGRLNQGARKLLESGAALKSGADALTGNSGKLRAGAADLKTGAAELQTGADALRAGTKKLTDGIDRLLSGALDLKSGMKEFDETGMGKLNEVLNQDLQKLADRIRAISDSSRDYKNFAGIAEGMDGSVKFIIETDAVKANTEKETK